MQQILGTAWKEARTWLLQAMPSLFSCSLKMHSWQFVGGRHVTKEQILLALDIVRVKRVEGKFSSFLKSSGVNILTYSDIERQ